MSLPDTRLSRAVLIGTSEYQYEAMPSLPAVANNLVGLKEALCDHDILGLSPQHCKVINDPTARAHIFTPLLEAASEAKDTLLVYYAGHGQVDQDGELQLALVGTNSDPRHLPVTAVAYNQIRRAVITSSALRRIVILDCCYSGRALGGMSGAQDAIYSTINIEGTVVLTASSKTQTALAYPGEPYTAFTAELLTVFREGLPDQPKLLSIKTIFSQIHSTLRAKARPLPQILNSNTAEDLALVKNRAIKPSRPSLEGYGAIAGVEPGTLFTDRRALSRAKVHRPFEAGICGRRSKGGAESIVLSGGYKDDVDYGDVIIYTGHGGQDSKRVHIKDQDPNDSGNAALITSLLTQLPVRVIRGAEAKTPFSPPEGYSYDGLFRVADYWSESGEDGFKVLRFRLESIERPDSTTNEPLIAPNRWSQVSRGVFQDRRLSERIKKLYNNECQVCGLAIETIGGMRYSETFHFRSLSLPHKGPDIAENMVCLCPNHHLLFELGAIIVDDGLRVIDRITGEPIADLNIHSRHRIGLQYVRYHRRLHEQGKHL
ncbi:caspase, EACC1-associated type [Nonomuraea sp. H19]|uniref:caspase, EACC1-associated type n=1 Tax=Nonomuraea sp. H19 TaxID=3452206 RepID=UPI003F89872F